MEALCNSIEIIPIRNILRVYACEKVRLRRKGTSIKDLDLLIGSTAKATNLILVTENICHLNHKKQFVLLYPE